MFGPIHIHRRTDPQTFWLKIIQQKQWCFRSLSFTHMYNNRLPADVISYRSKLFKCLSKDHYYRCDESKKKKNQWPRRIGNYSCICRSIDLHFFPSPLLTITNIFLASLCFFIVFSNSIFHLSSLFSDLIIHDDMICLALWLIVLGITGKP